MRRQPVRRRLRCTCWCRRCAAAGRACKAPGAKAKPNAVYPRVGACRIFCLKNGSGRGIIKALPGKELDAQSYEQYLRYHWAMCEKPEMLGHSNHLLFVARPL